MLKKIRIESYRSCFNTSLECHPHLSVLIGPNGSGKTNVLQAIMLLNRMSQQEGPHFAEGPAGVSSRLHFEFLVKRVRARLSATVETLFVHAKAFLVRERPPAVGDVIMFTRGTDGQGRPRAERVEPLYPNARILVRQFLAWVVLLAAPVLALRQLAHTVNAWLLFGAFAVVSIITYVLYIVDKHRAQAGAWRTRESTLHFFELIGGWPGAFLAQRHLRHKIRKVSYQVVFWLIVVAHQFAAIDYLRDWSMSRAVHALVSKLSR